MTSTKVKIDQFFTGNEVLPVVASQLFRCAQQIIPQLPLIHIISLEGSVLKLQDIFF